jgi:anti-anti-sigma factor
MLNFQTRQIPLNYGQMAMLVSPEGAIEKRTVQQFEKQLTDYYSVGYRYLILDCAGIHSINSTGLQVLLMLVETFQKDGGILLLIQVLQQISRFFDMLGFSPIFTSFTREDEAVQYLQDQLRQICGDAPPGSMPHAPAAPAPQNFVASGNPGGNPSGNPGGNPSGNPGSNPSGNPGGNASVPRAFQPTVAYNAQQSPQSLFSPILETIVQPYRRMYSFGIHPLRVRLIPSKRSGDSIV